MRSGIVGIGVLIRVFLGFFWGILGGGVVGFGFGVSLGRFSMGNLIALPRTSTGRNLLSGTLFPGTLPQHYSTQR